MPPKDKKKEKPAGWDFDPIEGFVVLIFFMAIVGSIISAILGYFNFGQAL